MVVSSTEVFLRQCGIGLQLKSMIVIRASETSARYCLAAFASSMNAGPSCFEDGLAAINVAGEVEWDMDLILDAIINGKLYED